MEFHTFFHILEGIILSNITVEREGGEGTEKMEGLGFPLMRTMSSYVELFFLSGLLLLSDLWK